MENVFPEETKAKMLKKGHDVLMVNRIAGGMNGILRDNKGMLHGGACWRADGTTMGISGGNTVPELLKLNPLY